MAFQKLLQNISDQAKNDKKVLFKAQFDVTFMLKKYKNIFIEIYETKINFSFDQIKKSTKYEIIFCNQITFRTFLKKKQNNICKQPIECIQLKKNDEFIYISAKRNEQLKKLFDFLKLKLNQTDFKQVFHICKKVGNGSFASVYEIQKKHDNKKYAAKVFDKKKTQSKIYGSKIINNQLDISRQLSQKIHKNVLNFQGSYQVLDFVYLCHELCEGGSLNDKIKSQFKFMNRHVKKIIYGILQGLFHLHQLKIMHRDIKPQNIMFRTKYDLQSVIIDFGFATKIGDYKLFSRCGTPGFVAPQIANLKNQNATYGVACDIFSVGVILHILLFKKPLFQGENVNQILKQNRACNIDFDNSKYDNIPFEWKDFMQKLLKFNPEERITAQQALKHQFFNVNPQFDNQFVGSNNFMKTSNDQKYKRSRFNPLYKELCPSNIKQVQGEKINIENLKPKPKKLRKDSCIQFVTKSVEESTFQDEIQEQNIQIIKEYQNEKDSPKAKVIAVKNIPVKLKGKKNEANL